MASPHSRYEAMDAAGLARTMRIDIGALAGALHAEHADAGRCGVLYLTIGTKAINRGAI
ncbi:hypothetical protein [Xanthomonas campestris]|uniref:hypothetical protein n=1 Tax=Xanthomonas campestris TaxID=339 RepID=UPI001D139F98|nr:hypothetical protein [Xanthomonas campestris]MCC3255630.1 hypothetical protein [Xanthomonas campestris pv. armoraciae]